MKLEHLAIWVDDIEAMRAFYQTYFGAGCGEKYFNPNKNFTSYFLSFGVDGCRIELMHRPDIPNNNQPGGLVKGLAHFALSVGSEELVNRLTEQLRADGYTITGEPRWSGDGYYESVILDPEGNRVEILK